MLKIAVALSVFFSLMAGPHAIAAKPTKEVNDRGVVGSTFSSPILYENALYFVATTGVLYRTNLDLSSPTKLFEGKKQTLGALTLVGSTLYWGEGLHQDNSVTLHAFDLKTKKILKEVSIDGHIEREIFHHNGILYAGLGGGGVGAFKINTLEKLWQTKEVGGKALHADGNLVFAENKICTTAIYDFKGVICLDPANGKVLNTYPLQKNPKSEIVAKNSLIIGFATEANLTDAKWTTPADFYVVDLKLNKVRFSKELRGFNFFAPHIVDDFAFVTLSTGDFISISLATGNIGFIGEFSEPFINNSFTMKGNLCGLGIMGKVLCYSKTKNGYGITNDKRMMETPIGKITTIGNKIYAPSRMSYFIIE